MGSFCPGNYGSGYYAPAAGSERLEIITEDGNQITTEGDDKLAAENLNDGGSAATVAVDPALRGFAELGQVVFGFAQLVPNYTDVTCTVKRVSDDAQQTFGQNPAGELDLDAIYDWADGSDAIAVNCIDQKGSAALWVFHNDVYIIQDGVTSRHWTEWDDTTGQIEFSTEEGTPGVILAGGGYGELTSSGIDFSSGAEVHVLCSIVNRKVPSSLPSTEPAGLGGTNTAECLVSYGKSTTNYLSYELGGGNFTHRTRRNGTGASGTDQSLTTGAPIVKANALHIFTLRFDASELALHAYDKKHQSVAAGAGNVTANATFGNGTLRVGRRYPGISGESTATGNLLFSGIIVTFPLTAAQRQSVGERLTRLANHNLAQNVADAKAVWQERLYWAKADPETGVLVGEEGLLTVQINTDETQYGQDPDWTFDYEIPNVGHRGLRNNDSANYASTWTATDNFFANVHSGAIMVLGHREGGGDLAQWMMNGTSNHSTDPPTKNSYTRNFAVGVGYHHSNPNFYRRVAASKDTNDITGHEGYTDNDGGKVSQTQNKYLFNDCADWDDNKVSTASVTVTNYAYGSNTIPSGTTLTNAVLAAVSPTRPPTPEHVNYSDSGIKFPFDNGFMHCQIVSFEKGSLYDPSASQAAREPYMRTGTNWMYNAPLAGTLIGHLDCSVVRSLGWGAIVHSDPAAKLQSAGYLENLQGTRVAFFFRDEPLTLRQAQQAQVNAYLLLEDEAA